MKQKQTHHRATSMPFLDHLVASASSSSSKYKKRQKRSHSPEDQPDNMPLFTQSSTFLAAPSTLVRKRSRGFLRRANDIDEYVSSDLEVSFASNVSLNSPPRDDLSLSPGCEPMDISPAPPPKPTFDSSRHRPRALTSGARLFGSDISNNRNSLLPSPDLTAASAANPVIGTTSGTQSNKRIQRSALPTEWLSALHPAEPPTSLAMQEPSSPMDDAMDVDTSYIANPVTSTGLSPAPASAAPTVTGFNQLFYDTMSPRRSFDSPSSHFSKKRRSLSPEAVRAIHEDVSSSPMLPSSPSEAKLDRMTNAAVSRSKPTLSGLGAPSASFLKRPRRPVLSAMVQSSGQLVHSAYPIASPSPGHPGEDPSPKGAAPPRRAFSAFLPPSIYTEPEDDESSFDGPDMSSPAQAYSKRQQVKTIRRCDGTEDFRPMTGASALVSKESPSRFMAPGLPGFGDNEAHGKLLPCHRVTEDGLMRINAETLDNLIDGKHNDQVADYHIIDCRFDYEYDGGHIAGAVNINTTAGIEEALLGGSLTKPKPSVSGDKSRKTVLVFHCEFSAKRAPTFAKHLRAKDRAMNNHIYPKIHYPEVYILEGGYCQYFKSSSQRCSPQAYVTMDDPNHLSSRREDLDQFRKARFGRVKSYAYGDGSNKNLIQQQQQPKRNTAPTSTAPPSLFAAASAARNRRGNTVSLMTLPEDANTTADGDDTDTDIGDSPCPPPTKATTFFKAKKLTARPIVRAETYGPSRMNY